MNAASFSKQVCQTFKACFWTGGRVGRLGYFLSYVPYLGLTTINPYKEAQAIIAVLFIGVILLVGIKRCHDLGHSGWWQLIPFYFIWMLIVPGEKVDNQYGPKLD